MTSVEEHNRGPDAGGLLPGPEVNTVRKPKGVHDADSQFVLNQAQGCGKSHCASSVSLEANCQNQNDCRRRGNGLHKNRS